MAIFEWRLLHEGFTASHRDDAVLFCLRTVLHKSFTALKQQA